MSRNVQDQTIFCAPGLWGGSKDKMVKTCFDRDALMRIIREYNKKYPNNTISYSRKDTNQTLWNLIRDGLAERCGDKEWCWLDQDFLQNDHIIQNYYKPVKPKSQYQWLSTSDIDRVLTQYENQFPDFEFMGTVPIDFDQVVEEYKNLNLCKRDLRYKKYGFVFNLDPHDKRGSHWVCMFMTLNAQPPYIGYFDSYGHPPPKQIKKLIERLRSQAKECLNLDLVYKCNTVQHQRKNTECGVYCLYFIYQSLHGYSFEEITENIILDDTVNQFRHFFFRPTVNYNGYQPVP